MSLIGQAGPGRLEALPTVEPSVAAARAKLAFRVRELLADRGWLEPVDLAAQLGTTTAEVMFAVRELERAGLVRVVDTPPGEAPTETSTS